MGKIVVTEFVSLDGVMEDPGGAEGFKHGGWTFEFDSGDEGNQLKLDETLEADALLLGRVTYEGFAAAWPSMEDPVGFADKMNSVTTILPTCSPFSWRSVLCPGVRPQYTTSRLLNQVD